jgi:hypothetical protein
VFAMSALHIQVLLRSTVGTSTSSSGTCNEETQREVDLSQDLGVPAFFHSLNKNILTTYK